MTNKFMRNYFIEIFPPEGESIAIGDVYAHTKTENWTYPNLLTVDLDIKRDTFASANEAHIQIYNLGADTRQLIYQDKYRIDRIVYIKVYAGYGKDIKLVFFGKILQAYSYKRDVNMITDIEALDIGFLSFLDYSTGRKVNYTNLTLEAGTSKQEAINQIVSNMEKQTSLGAIGSLKDVEYQTPTTFMGNCFSLLDTMTGGHVFIDLGKINILSNTEAIDIGEIPIINSDTGLLGTPRRRDAQLEIDVLFEPNIIVGQLVEIKSSTAVKEFNGTYKVVGVHHMGTISSAVCGTLTTRLNLFAGVLLPHTDITLTNKTQSENQTQSGSQSKTTNLTLVSGTKTRDYKGNIPESCKSVYRYIQQNRRSPVQNIPDTMIKWSEAIPNNNLTSGVLPTLQHVTNVYNICRALTNEVRRNYGNKRISVSSCWRSPSNNKSVGGTSTSLHLSGNAIDITSISDLTSKQLLLFLDSIKSFPSKEVLEEQRCMHIGWNRKGGTSYGTYSTRRGWHSRKQYQYVNRGVI